MPFSDYHNRDSNKNRNEYYRERDLYYNYNSRSNRYNVQISSESDGEYINNNFCPIHKQVAIFDRYVSHKYLYPCCMREVPNDVMDIDTKEVGISTIDGRTSSDPRYGRTTETGGGGIIVPATQTRSSRVPRQQLSPDDAKLARRGYKILQTVEKVGNSPTLKPTLGGSIDIDNYRKDPLEEKHRRIHGLGHL